MGSLATQDLGASNALRINESSSHPIRPDLVLAGQWPDLSNDNFSKAGIGDGELDIVALPPELRCCSVETTSVQS